MRQRDGCRACMVFILIGACLAGHAGDILFEDVTASTGLETHLKTWRLAHGASWGDLNNDGWPELYVGAFASLPRWQDGPLPNMLFINSPDGRFTLDAQKPIQFEGRHARASHVLLADLDQDGDLDMMVACHHSKIDDAPSTLWENMGGGVFREVTPKSGYWPHPMGYRNVTAIDLNDDGLLDLVACDNNYSNWRSGQGTLMVFMNKGNFTFEDGRERYGFPADGTTGFGLAVGDVNDDGRFDFFVADSNRLFVSRPDGRYQEVQPGTFLKPQSGDRESRTCGAVFGDVNGDGLLDLATSEHGGGAQVRLYINTGITGGLPRFRHVTQETGLEGALPRRGITGLAVKIGQLAIVDLDNDGRKDIWLGVTWQDEQGRLQPMVYRNLGNGPDGLPRFSRPALDRIISYYACAPLADYDRDGRVDCFMAAWFAWHETPSILFRNVTPGGHWLSVRVSGGGRRNTMGIGAVVRAYRAGQAEMAKALIQRQDIATGTGYASGEEAIAHLGLGTNSVVDLVVRWGQETRLYRNQAANQRVEIDWLTSTTKQ